MVDAAVSRGGRPGHRDRPGRAGAGRLRGLRDRPRARREPRRPARGAGGARRADEPRRAPQRHRGHRAPLRGRAGALAAGGSWASRASPAASRRSRSRAGISGGPRPSPWLLALLATGLLSRPALVLAGPLARGDHGDRPAVRAGQPGRPHPGRPRRRARRAGAHHQPVRRPAAGADGGDRPRPGAHRRHPLRHGRRRPRGGPPGHRDPRQPEPRRRPWTSATPSAATTSR